MAATAKVLNTTELLEAILLELPMRDLLVHARRVCQTWRLTITTSVQLQRALYLVPPSTREQVYAVHDRELEERERKAADAELGVELHNATSRELYDEYCKHDDEDERHWKLQHARYWHWRTLNDDKPRPVYVNLLLHRIHVQLGDAEKKMFGWKYDFVIYLDDFDTLADEPESWFSMFVTSPPSSELTVRFKLLFCDDGVRIIKGKGGGVRIGELIRALKAANFRTDEVMVRIDGSVAWEME